MNDLAGFQEPDAHHVIDALNAYVEAPDPRVRSAHLTAIAAETAPLRLAGNAAHRSASRQIPHPTRRFRLTPKRLALLPAALLVAFLGAAGLAVAGVTLPTAARAPFDAVGVQLPNQSSSGDVHAVIDATPPSDRGCAFGHAVATAASQGRTHAPADACGHEQGQGQAQSGAHGQAQSHAQNAAGHGNAASKPSGVPPTPPAGQQFGQSTAADAQQNASNDGQSFGERTSQGAQSLTPSAPPAAASDQGGVVAGATSSSPGASNVGSPPGGSAPESPPGGSVPGSSHAP